MLEDILKAIRKNEPNGLRTVFTTRALAAAGNYAAEDVLSESAATGTAWTFDFGKKGGSFLIVKAIVSCSVTALTPRIAVFLFDDVPTATKNDNAANTAPVNADVLRGMYQGCIEFPALNDLGGNSTVVVTPSTSGNLPLAVACHPSNQNLYGIVVLKDAVTGESAGMNLTISFDVEPYHVGN